MKLSRMKAAKDTQGFGGVLIVGMWAGAVAAGCSDTQQQGQLDGAGSLEASADQLGEDETSGTYPVAVGHGMLLYSDDTWRKPTPSNLRQSQSYLIQRLHSEADSVAKERLAREVPRARQTSVLTGATPAAAEDLGPVEADAEVLDWLIQAVAPRDAAALVQLSGFIRQHASKRLNAAGRAESTSGVGSTSSALTSANAGAAYEAECAAAGVPSPPPWGSSSWIKWTNGSPTLTPILIAGGIAEVYFYHGESSRGLCIALPRRDSTSDTTINVLGIICQGNDTSRACFWDSLQGANIDVNEVVSIPSTKIIGGTDLVGNNGGVCTDCHAGENAFIVHPQSLLDLGASLNAQNWVRPLVDASWVQNVAPGKELQRMGQPCTNGGCHTKADKRRFPRLENLSSDAYCRMARYAVGITMQASAVHETALGSLCAGRTRAAANRFSITKALWHGFFSAAPEVPRVGDFDGDGRSDIVTITSNGSACLSRSTGAGFAASSVCRPSFAALSEQIKTGDFNGDGRDDLITARMNGGAQVFVALSSVDGFGAATNFNGLVFANEVYETGDFNGDRLDDIAVFTKRTSNDVVVQLSVGWSFGPPNYWHGNFSPGSEVPLVGDFNADGYDDIASFTGGSAMDVVVALSNGSSFGTSTTWHASFGTTSEVKRVADMNGDGRDDIVTFNRNNHRAYVAYSTGTSFTSSVLWHSNFADVDQEPFVADVDADHRADGVLFTKGSTADVLVSLAIP